MLKYFRLLVLSAGLAVLPASLDGQSYRVIPVSLGGTIAGKCEVVRAYASPSLHDDHKGPTDL